MKRLDVLALGELLIDFCVSVEADGTPRMVGSAGGAPANVLAAVCRLGGTGQLVAKVGRDLFGDYLERCVKALGIDTTSLLRDPCRTTLAFVQLAADGDRSFSFERNPGADTQLQAHELHPTWFEQARVFHFGSLSLTDNPSRDATFSAIDMAKAADCIISFDPNLRPPLWRDLDEARSRISTAIALADLVKISDDEVLFLTGESNLDEGISRLRSAYPSVRLAVTCGAKGAIVDTDSGHVHIPSLPVVAIDTTAAGDAFLGALLYRLTRSDGVLRDAIWDDNLFLDAVSFANAAGALTTTKRGAMDALPTLPEILAHLPA
ncbi:carbohydrate kinase family protein [Alicyclobacillus sacchari]|uniref:carbohydrate kinase family protein n=1 Tax=Alicyclobacillus sacchari TaxID=392010 RepID=UPI0024E17050|nr:carbohydrate kinase [Alicyclobacillus sacchari]